MTLLNPHYFYDAVFSSIPEKVDGVIDVGAGRGTIGSLLRIYRSVNRLVALDYFDQYLSDLRQHGQYDEVVKHDIRNLPLPFSSLEFDYAISSEVIEHLTKPDAIGMINDLKRIAKHVIITTPNGYQHQEALDNNQFQMHLSGWKAEELRKLGFRVMLSGRYNQYGKWLTRLPEWTRSMTFFLLEKQPSTLIGTHPK